MSKFFSLDTLTTPKKPKFHSPEYFVTLATGKRRIFYFTRDCLKYLRQFDTCVELSINEEHTILRASATKLGMNPKEKLTSSHKGFVKLIMDRFKLDEPLSFAGTLNPDEKCIDFDISKLK